jgi:hypothetical protein
MRDSPVEDLEKDIGRLGRGGLILVRCHGLDHHPAAALRAAEWSLRGDHGYLT